MTLRLKFPAKLSVAQKVLALAGALYAGASSVPDIALPWYRVGTFGFGADFAGAINRIEPGGAAARAGLHLNPDRPARIDIEKTAPEFRRYLLDFGYARVGDSATFVVDDGMTPPDVTIEALPAAFSRLDSIAAVLFALAYLTLIATGVGLLFRRPSWMTFAFYCYAVMTADWSWLASALLPWSIYEPWSTVEGLLNVLNWFPLALFALCFPTGTLRGWRTRAAAILFVLFGVAFVGSLVGVAEYWSHPTGFLTQALYCEPVAGLLLAVGLMFANAVAAPAGKRMQLVIVMTALLVGNLGLDVSSIASFAPGVPVVPIWFVNMLAGLNVIVSVTVAYAILRYRLFGIIISRTLAYSILTFGLFIAVELVRHVIGKAFSETFAQFVLALVLVIVLGTTQKHLERGIYHWLFSARRQARARLLLVEKRLAQAESTREIASLLVGEPLEELGLASAALFGRTASGFTRDESRNWDAAAPETLDGTDAIVEQLRREQRPLPACASLCRWALLPEGDTGSVVAMPVMSRGKLEAIVFYGPQESGERFDRYDLETFQALAAKASAAYDRLELESERRTVKKLSRVLNKLRELLGEH